MTPEAQRDLDRHVVVVTGAAGGLGSALVERFALDGATVVACDIDLARLEALASGADGPGSVVRHAVDLRDPDACRAVVDRVTSELGRLDAIVNNAALLRAGPLETFPVEAFDEMIAVNLRAPFLLTQSAFAWMAGHGGGRIVNIASVGARDGGGSLDVAAYTTTKSGLLGMTKAYAKFGAPLGIIVNAVLPGGIRTPMIAEAAKDEGRARPDVPVGRLAEPDEVAALVRWLCGPENTYCVGATIDINGGRHLA